MRSLPARGLAALVLAAALPTSAGADEIEVRIDDGHIIATTTVDASVEAARALLGDPVRLAQVEGRGAEVSSRPVDGCIVSRITAPSGLGQIEYTVRSCEVADGFVGSLVEAEQLRSMDARWTFTEEDGRLRLTYDLVFVPRVAVPARLVAMLAKRGVRRLLVAVRDELAGG